MEILKRIVLSVLAILSVWTGPAWGHALPHRTEPRVGATVATSPARVRIWFDGPLEPSSSTICVVSERGQQVDKRDGHVDSRDMTLLEISLPSLSPGTYRVVWSVITRDGHRTEGDFTFTVK